MARVSEAKKLEAVEAVKGGTPDEEAAKRAGVKVETLQAWKGEKPKVLQLKPRSLKVRRGRARLPKAKGQPALLPTLLDVERQAARLPGLQWKPLPGAPTALNAMALMWRSGLPPEAFREALALLEW